jgi:peptide/nickel transport system ATP-binding protein
MAELVQLPAGHIDRYPRQLSGGERQRVGIARALAASPQMIICDEPVSALDVSVQASILNLLDDLRRELDISYLFISHDISVVAHLADRIVIMFAGRIVTQGSAKALLEGPYHPYTQELLASFNAGTLASKSVSPATNPGDGCKFFSRCAFRMPGVCDRIVPPLVSLSPDLEIACHLDKDALPTPPTGAGISFERETTAIAASRG